LDQLLLEPARAWPDGRFVMAGPQYPQDIVWPRNVRRVTHLPPGRHRTFYTSQRYTLNLTRRAMRSAGWSPSVRLFEAAACGTPIISDAWPGLEEFFVPGRDILVALNGRDTLSYLRDIPEKKRRAIGRAGRARVLKAHTAAHRAAELEAYVLEISGCRAKEPRFPRRSAGATAQLVTGTQ
jgi:spore maturation protein CgeB